MSFDLGDYVDVSERIQKFYAAHPDGRIEADPAVVQALGDRLFIGVVARVFRSPDDTQPCQGQAWEPFPGKTPYTRDSEAMNAETSAVGRALALAGIEVRRSIATRGEVQNRRAERTPQADILAAPNEVAEVVALYATGVRIEAADEAARKLWPRMDTDQRAQVTEARAGAVPA